MLLYVCHDVEPILEHCAHVRAQIMESSAVRKLTKARVRGDSAGGAPARA